MEFIDLIFKKRHHGGIGAYAKFENVTVSIQAGKYMYSRPRESGLDSSEYTEFEVGMWDDERNWITSKYLNTDGDQIASNVSKEDINKLLLALQKV